jgi:hypothetical protein
MSLTRAQIIETVQRSPACVAAQDKAAWLALFSADGTVEDPVGSAVNRKGRNAHRTGEDELNRFWDTFIAGNEIRFEVKADRLGGGELARDVVIHTRLATGMAIEVPAYLLYEVVEEQGAPRIRRLRACWDLRQRSTRALAAGPIGLWTLAAMSARMLRVQPVRWALDYSRALTTGIFRRGGQLALALARALDAGDRQQLEALFALGGTIELPVGAAPRAPVEAIDAGASLHVEQPISSGWLTGFGYERRLPGNAPESGVGFLELDPRSRRIARARFFAGG